MSRTTFNSYWQRSLGCCVMTHSFMTENLCPNSLLPCCTAGPTIHKFKRIRLDFKADWLYWGICSNLMKFWNVGLNILRLKESTAIHLKCALLTFFTQRLPTESDLCFTARFHCVRLDVPQTKLNQQRNGPGKPPLRNMHFIFPPQIKSCIGNFGWEKLILVLIFSVYSL